jgi:hypothetical protein
MNPAATAVTRVLGLGLVLLGGVACTADEPTADEVATPVAIVPEQTVPAARLSVFCQSMNDINERLDSDPPEDSVTFVLENYRSLLDEVPDAIALDFAAVIADLEGNPISVPVSDSSAPTTGEATSSTSLPADATLPADTVADATDDGATASTALAIEGDELPDEGYSPGDTPAERVNSYVAFVCRDTANNPGPPATEPLPAPVTTST